jgi:hypothetical protein
MADLPSSTDKSRAALRAEARHARRLAQVLHDSALRARLEAIADEFDAEANALEGRLSRDASER